MTWQAAEKVQKNSAGQYRAMINGLWTPVSKAQKNSAGQYRVMIEPEQPEDTTSWVTGEMSGLDKFLAGGGKAVVDMGRGLGQMAGLVDDQSVISARERDAALMDTGAGMAGNIAGSIAALAPTAMIPGANTYAGASAVGGIYGALQPTAEDESRLLNTAIGGGLGAAGKFAGDKLAQGLRSINAGKAAEQSRNAVRDSVLRQSQDAGYVLPKSEVSPAWFSNRLESIAGKAALKQDATLRNQEVTNSLARKVIGLSDDQPITAQAIRNYQDKVSRPYKDVAALSKKAGGYLEKLKEVRNDAQSYWSHYNISKDPRSMKMAKALDAQASKLETSIEAIAQSKGRPGLVDSLRESRKLLARSFDVKRALNDSTGDIDAKVLARLLEKGKPLTDELKTVGQFAQAFPKFSAKGVSVPAAGVGKTEALAAALLAGTGAYSMGPEGMLMGGLALASAPTRNALLSKAAQSMIQKSYSAPMMAKLLMGAPGQVAAKYGPMALAMGAAKD